MAENPLSLQEKEQKEEESWSEYKLTNGDTLKVIWEMEYESYPSCYKVCFNGKKEFWSEKRIQEYLDRNGYNRKQKQKQKQKKQEKAKDSDDLDCFDSSDCWCEYILKDGQIFKVLWTVDYESYPPCYEVCIHGKNQIWDEKRIADYLYLNGGKKKEKVK